MKLEHVVFDGMNGIGRIVADGKEIPVYLTAAVNNAGEELDYSFSFDYEKSWMLGQAALKYDFVTDVLGWHWNKKITEEIARHLIVGLFEEYREESSIEIENLWIIAPEQVCQEEMAASKRRSLELTGSHKVWYGGETKGEVNIEKVQFVPDWVGSKAYFRNKEAGFDIEDPREIIAVINFGWRVTTVSLFIGGDYSPLYSYRSDLDVSWLLSLRMANPPEDLYEEEDKESLWLSLATEEFGEFTLESDYSWERTARMKVDQVTKKFLVHLKNLPVVTGIAYTGRAELFQYTFIESLSARTEEFDIVNVIDTHFLEEEVEPDWIPARGSYLRWALEL
jgi:hypothetical protein